MTFKIDRLVGRENSVVLRTCGRMDIECVNTLKDLTEAESFKIILDLSEVTLADRDAAMFLAICELKVLNSRIAPLFSVIGSPRNGRAHYAVALPMLYCIGAPFVAMTSDYSK
jgi:hypothetical protein